MSTRSFPYNDYPYQDFHHYDFPYNEGMGDASHRIRPATNEARAYLRGAGAWWHTPIYLFLYSPFLWTGYRLSEAFLPSDRPFLTRILFLLLFSLLTHQSFHLIRGIYTSLRRRKSIAWLPLFLICNSLFFIWPILSLYTRLSPSFPHWGLPAPYALLPLLVSLYLVLRFYKPLSPYPSAVAGRLFKLGIWIGDRLSKCL